MDSLFRPFLYRILIIILVISLTFETQAQVNAYARVSGVSGTTINVTNVDETFDTFEPGGQIIIMQMQDDVIGNTTNTSDFGDLGTIQLAGSYEVADIDAVNEVGGVPNSINISSTLSRSYNTGANSAVQVVSYPELGGGGNYTTTADINALSWDGNIGGIVAFRVGGDLTLLHNILADGAGFRGGAVNGGGSESCDDVTYRTTASENYAYKGEGIYNSTDNTYEAARGKILNGGGGANTHNGGGGGGSNYSAGGEGGPGWTTPPPCDPGAGGLGGLALSTHITGSRFFLGGGGGAGEGNNGDATAGGNGGGIILISANSIVTTSTCTGVAISANGDDANSTSGAGNDGAGGGGAGGSILLNVSDYNIDGDCQLTISTNGGDGGDVAHADYHGGGGGGGMGTVIFSSAAPTTNVTTTTDPGTGGDNSSNPDDGSGDSGGGTSGDGISEGSGNTPLPVEMINFYGNFDGNYVTLNWSTATELNNDYFEIQLSQDGKRFATVGKVDGTGTTNTISEYEFTHFNQRINNSYYRLKQVDYDGHHEYSKVILVNKAGERAKKVKIYPNPSRGDNINIEMYSQHKDVVHYEVINMYGKLVMEAQHNTHAGINKFMISDSKLTKGVYTLRIFYGDKFTDHKLVVN